MPEELPDAGCARVDANSVSFASTFSTVPIIGIGVTMMLRDFNRRARVCVYDVCVCSRWRKRERNVFFWRRGGLVLEMQRGSN